MRSNPDRLAGWLVIAVAALVASVSARPYAGCWNDGSRLATVECLVDYHTLAIDNSVFVRVPPPLPGRPAPYADDEPGLLAHGTLDKLFIAGHYYSDKSPVPAILMAGVYQVLQWTTGLTASDQPDSFCYWLTLLTCGGAYVAAVWCVFALGGAFGLPLSLRLVFAASLAGATVALPYVRHVNNHVLLLGVAAALMLQLTRLPDSSVRASIPWLRLFAVGTLAGLCYAIDLGTGPLLLLCVMPLIGWRSRSFGAVAAVLMGALPWLVLHHAVNYAVGGSFKPANAIAEYFNWPGCPFNAGNMTGTWNHEHAGRFLLYAGDLLVGKRGFLGHNLPLLLALIGAAVLLWRRVAEWPEILMACAWSVGTWLVYAVTSSNHAGLCCSVRWFVPLLAPGYLVLAILLSRCPEYRPDFLLLSSWGGVLGAAMWWQGPWAKHMVPIYWPVLAAALLSWALFRRRRFQAQTATHDGGLEYRDEHARAA
jgi:hypothetical protein